MNKTLFFRVLLAIAFMLALTSGAQAQTAYKLTYAGYYAATGYDKDGSGKITDDVDGFPAALAEHVELYADGTYQMLYFGALTSGKWTMKKTEKGNEYAGLLFGKTVDNELAGRYKKNELAFMLMRNKKGHNWLMQTNSDEQFYMEKQPGKFDVDKVLDEIAKELAVEE
jgi:hypothetical protein